MKRRIEIVSAALGLAAIGLLASSCGLESAEIRQMGPPGKPHTVSGDRNAKPD